MKEKIILAPSVNSAELTRSLARYGKRQMGCRFMGAVELARYALQLSGKSMKREFLPKNEEAAVIYSFLADIPYFGSASFSDASNLASSLDNIRSLICENEADTMKNVLSSGEFPEKNRAVLTVYERYLSKLGDRYTDSIGLIRMATAEASPFCADFCYLSEFELSPIEKKLMDFLSEGKAEEQCLCDLFDVEKKQLHIASHTDSYGASNEVEHIIGEICRKNIPFDNCTVAITNVNEYAQLFYEASVRYNIPITFGCGVPIMNANPAILLKALSEWDSVGYHDVEAFRKIVFSDAFDRKKLLSLLEIEYNSDLKKLVEVAGNLRISYDNKYNDTMLNDYRRTLTEDEKVSFLPKMRLLSAEFSKGCAYIIETYSVIRCDLAGRIDRSAVKVITDALNAYTKYSDRSIFEIIPDILSKTVCSENSREGALYVTSMEGAISSIRENLYVAGLSASLFPGSPKENYLVLDNDYALFPNHDQALTSTRKPEKKKKKLFDLLSFASSLAVPVHLSYSGFSSSELKVQNPSSVLFEIYQSEHGECANINAFESNFHRVDFFSENIGRSGCIGKAFVDGKKIAVKPAEELSAQDLTMPERSFSPTAIESFFDCPMKFYLNKILGINMPKEDDPFEVISPNDAGTLAHSLMEMLAEKKVTRNAFTAEAEKIFDEFLLSHPPLHNDAVIREKRDFVKMMQSAFDNDPHNEVVSAEEKTTVTHPSGITLEGIPDRVEKTKDGKYIIVDFKTGRNIKHRENDLGTCLQTVLYAYMTESRGKKIAHCEYRYLREGKTVVCDYSDEIKARLNEKMTEFQTALDTCNFDYAEDCKYCDFSAICNKPKQEEAVDE